MIMTKLGVSLLGLKSPILHALIIMCNLTTSNYGKNITVTSTTEGVHREASLHPCGYAVDIRSWSFTTKQMVDIYAYMSNNLGPDYDVIMEKDHLHIEYEKGKELCHTQ